MDLKAIYRSLSAEQQQQFLEVAGTTDAYMTVHLIHRRRVPRPDLMGRIADACRAVGHGVTNSDVVLFFHGAPTATSDSESAQDERRADAAEPALADPGAPKRDRRADERRADFDGRRADDVKSLPDSTNRRVKPERRAAIGTTGPEVV